jgi:hypothetical protein
VKISQHFVEENPPLSLSDKSVYMKIQIKGITTLVQMKRR